MIKRTRDRSIEAKATAQSVVMVLAISALTAVSLGIPDDYSNFNTTNSGNGPIFAVIDLGANVLPQYLNNLGSVVYSANGSSVFWKNGVSQPIGFLAVGLNDSDMVAGTIVGVSDPLYQSYPVVWQNNATTPNTNYDSLFTIITGTGGGGDDRGTNGVLWSTNKDNANVVGIDNLGNVVANYTKWEIDFEYQWPTTNIVGGGGQTEFIAASGSIPLIDSLGEHGWATTAWPSGVIFGSQGYWPPFSSNFQSEPGATLVSANSAGEILAYYNLNVVTYNMTTKLTQNPPFGGSWNTNHQTVSLTGAQYYDPTTTPFITNGLSNLIPPNSGWSGVGGGAINDSGAIVGTATYSGTNTAIAAGSHGVMLIPLKVTWETISDNTPIDDNNNPVSGQPMPGGGKRIFPDKKNPTDTGTGRNKVTLRVDTGGSGAGWTVYVKVFDVADPTPDPTQVIHPHGTATGDTVGGDNFTDPASTPLTGSFTSHDSTVDTAHATLDSNGKHDFEFNVGYQPGNNYRVAVTFFKPDDLNNLQVTDSTQPGYVPMDASKTPSGFSGGMSPPLTVWRRLWIEQDSMAAVPTTGPQQNVVSGIGVVSITRDSPVTGQSTLGSGQLFGDSANRFENGTMTINGTAYPVVGNTANSLVADSVIITGTPSDAAVLGKSYTLVDDDEYGLPSGWSPLMPRYSIINNAVISRYAPSYILPVDATTYNTNPSVAFYLNDESYSDMSASKDLTTSATCWTHLVTSAYQPNQSEDHDPNSESSLFGGTFTTLFGNKEVSAIWLETIRDSDDLLLRSPVAQALGQSDFLNSVANITSHEIGHAPGNQTEDQDHAEGGIMTAGGQGGNTFTAPSLLRFRKSQTWNGD